jgi:hypothetical protein
MFQPGETTQACVSALWMLNSVFLYGLTAKILSGRKDLFCALRSPNSLDNQLRSLPGLADLNRFSK